MTTPNLPAEWEPNEWLPAANVAGPLGSGLSSLPQWDREAFDDWIKARAKAMIDDALDVFEDAGLPIAAMRAWMDAIVSAIQGDFGPLEDLVGDTILGFVPDFTELKDAMLGEYTGSDPVLLAISNLFALLRKVLELIGGVASGNLPTIQQLVDGFGDLASAVGGLIEGLFKIPIWQVTNEAREIIDRFDGLSTVKEIEGWSWDENDGHDHDGCALFTATGTPGVLLSPTPVEVREGEQYTVSAWAKATGTSGGGISLGVQWFDAEHVAVSSSTAQTVGSPSTSWAKLEGTVTVPAGARYSRRMLKVDATAGEVRWDDVRFTGEATSIAQDWVTGLPGALADLGDWIESLVDQLLGALGIPSLGTLFDKISDLSDEVESWLGDTQDRAAELLNLIDDLWSSPSSVIGAIPQALVSGLDTTLNQIRDVFDGLVVTPVNSVVAAIKDWFDQWFGGGSGNAIPLSQKGAVNGVAPLNASSKLATSYLQTNIANGVAGLNGSGKVATSLLVTDSANNVPTLDGSGKIQSGQLPDFSSSYLAVGTRGAANGVAPLNSNAVVPLANLPEEVGGSGGSGAGRPYVILYLGANVSVASNTPTILSGWSQSGTASVTLDGSNQKWRLPIDGLWAIEAYVAWATGTTGYRLIAVTRDITVSGSSVTGWMGAGQAANTMYNISGTQGAGVQRTSTTQRMTDWTNVYEFGADDWLGVGVRHTQGSALNVLGVGVPFAADGQSIVTCTYLGAA